MHSKIISAFGLVTVLSLAACTGGEAAAGSDAAVAVSADAVQPAAAAAQPTGNVIEVRMVTEGASNYFEPAEVTARPGDVIRFTLVSGLHNVSCPAGLNGSAAGLPEATPFLQTPGQYVDVPVNMEPGSYTFHCDPHVAMGMVGRLIVE